jgi:glutathione S-transferase
MIQLYQFYFSHYCEKARWALDYKGIPYRPRNLLPGLHVKPALKLAPKTCLPIIKDGDNAVQDSTTIIDFLDRKYPQHPLTPSDPVQAEEALAWEEYCDEEIGVTLRLWFYYHALPDRKRAVRFMLDGAPWYGRPVLAVLFPKVRSVMIEAMNINAEAAKQSETRLLAALDRLDNALQNRRFLVGDAFSRADLTACALLSPWVLPGDVEAARNFPEPVYALRDQQKTRPLFAWVRDLYKNYRRAARTVAGVAA